MFPPGGEGAKTFLHLLCSFALLVVSFLLLPSLCILSFADTSSFAVLLTQREVCQGWHQLFCGLIFHLTSPHHVPSFQGGGSPGVAKHEWASLGRGSLNL